MRRIAVINQKGGVGKTTTSANLGAALAQQGRRVVLIDMDAQANLSISLGVELASNSPSTYTVLLGESTIAEALRPTAIVSLSLIASNIDLSGAELELAGAIGREHLMRDAIAQWESEHKKAHGRPPADYLIFDCPPSLGLLSINALAAAGEVLITLQTEFLALQGMTKLVDVVQLLRRRVNPELVITGILPCLYDSRLKLAREVLGEIRSYFGAQVFPHPVRTNVKLAEAPSFGKTIFEYAPESNGAQDYRYVAREVMLREGRDADLAGLPPYREVLVAPTPLASAPVTHPASASPNGASSAAPVITSAGTTPSRGVEKPINGGVVTSKASGPARNNGRFVRATPAAEDAMTPSSASVPARSEIAKQPDEPRATNRRSPVAAHKSAPSEEVRRDEPSVASPSSAASSSKGSSRAPAAPAHASKSSSDEPAASTRSVHLPTSGKAATSSVEVKAPTSGKAVASSDELSEPFSGKAAASSVEVHVPTSGKAAGASVEVLMPKQVAIAPPNRRPSSRGTKASSSETTPTLPADNAPASVVDEPRAEQTSPLGSRKRPAESKPSKVGDSTSAKAAGAPSAESSPTRAAPAPPRVSKTQAATSDLPAIVDGTRELLVNAPRADIAPARGSKTKTVGPVAPSVGDESRAQVRGTAARVETNSPTPGRRAAASETSSSTPVPTAARSNRNSPAQIRGATPAEPDTASGSKAKPAKASAPPIESKSTSTAHARSNGSSAANEKVRASIELAEKTAARSEPARSSRVVEITPAPVPIRDTRESLRRIVRAEDLPPLPPDAFEILTSYVRDA